MINYLLIPILIFIIFAIIICVLFVWCLISIIHACYSINEFVDLEYKKFKIQKSGSRETPDGEEPLH